MAKFIKTSTVAKADILYFDHYVGKTYTVPDDGVVANSEGKKIVPAGTILPANDATAKGVLLEDVDVTYGDAPGTLVVHGFIDNAKLVAASITVTAAAMGVLRQIEFVGATTVPQAPIAANTIVADMVDDTFLATIVNA